MIYFSPTIRALNAHIADLKDGLAKSEKEREALLDRLLARNNIAVITEEPKTQVASNPRVISPPWAGPADVQSAERQVWLQEETTYLMSELGYEDWRARSEAERRYEEQNGVIT